jgi:hypothetical protein
MLLRKVLKMTKRTEMETDGSVRVKSVKDFVDAVCRGRDEWIEGSNYFDPWFRGQTNESWDLTPNIFRYELQNEEDEIRAEFQRRGPQLLTEPPPNDFWGWYFLMQHYGAPTRLLDWTDSALVALFFALNSPDKNPQDVEDSVVWMLDPWWLNKRVLGDQSILLPSFKEAGEYLAEPYDRLNSDAETRIKPRDPAALDPPFIARRVAAQRSHFTIFGNDKDGLTRLGGESGSRLRKIVLAKEGAARMRADLGTLGITDTTIYPDLRALSDELIRYRMGGWPV